MRLSVLLSLLAFGALSVFMGFNSSGVSFDEAVRDALLGPWGSLLDRLFYVLVVVLSPVLSLLAISGESSGWQIALLLRFGSRWRLLLRSLSRQLVRSVIVAVVLVIGVTLGVWMRVAVIMADVLRLTLTAVVVVTLVGTLVGLLVELTYRYRNRHPYAIAALAVVVALAQIPGGWNPVAFASGPLLPLATTDWIRAGILVAVLIAGAAVAPHVFLNQMSTYRRQNDST